PISHRVLHDFGNWRGSGGLLRGAGGQTRLLGLAAPERRTTLVGDGRTSGRAQCRLVLRHVSGIEGRQARSRGSVAIGIGNHLYGYARKNTAANRRSPGTL